MEGIPETTYLTSDSLDDRVCGVRTIHHKIGIRYTALYRKLLTLYLSLLEIVNRDIIQVIIQTSFNVLLAKLIYRDSISWKVFEDTCCYLSFTKKGLVYHKIKHLSEGVTVIYNERPLFVPNLFFRNVILDAYHTEKCLERDALHRTVYQQIGWILVTFVLLPLMLLLIEKTMVYLSYLLVVKL